MAEKLIEELRNLVGKWYFNSNGNIVKVIGFTVDKKGALLELNTGNTVKLDYFKKYYKEVQK